MHFHYSIRDTKQLINSIYISHSNLLKFLSKCQITESYRRKYLRFLSISSRQLHWHLLTKCKCKLSQIPLHDENTRTLASFYIQAHSDRINKIQRHLIANFWFEYQSWGDVLKDFPDKFQ